MSVLEYALVEHGKKPGKENSMVILTKEELDKTWKGLLPVPPKGMSWQVSKITHGTRWKID